MDKNIVLGIDLGTTYSCAAYLHAGKPKIIPSEKGYATVPSVVGLTRKGEVVVGQPALDQMVTKPEDTIYSSKRLIGRKFNSLIVQRMKQLMTYSIVEGPNMETAVMLGMTRYTLPQISALILGEIREVAQRMLETEINRAVITVPAYYSDNQRQAVREAGRLAGLTVERIINEPTAAALAYGYNKGLNQKILIFDLGGGTFDVSILHLQANEFRVLATGGDTFLGGVDFDQRIVTYVIDKFKEATGKDLRGEKVPIERVRAAAERVKRELSSEKNAKIQLPFITQIKGDPVDLDLVLTRDQLNQLTGDLVDRTMTLCDRVMTSGNLKVKDIDEVLLVGGQTRMPLVQDKIEKHFGKTPRKGVHPDEVVACGAAILGGFLAQGTKIKLKDVLSIPIGIALPNGKFKPVLEQNTPIPAAKAYKVSVPPGAPLEVDVYQGDKATVVDNEYIGSFKFPAPREGEKKSALLELRFQLSEECLLTVEARNAETGAVTSQKMTTLQTPKSLRDGLATAMGEKDAKNDSSLRSFAKKVLGDDT